MALNKQMELFEDGGLRDEGGMIDETSGNDVPTGSTREEVRDDIPAQLSEGEFVLPADVVRFHGLEKIMALRDEAKAGLAKMEDMGQMGNSEEATLPDDMPFSLEDLDMEDEPQEMAEGGYVMVAGKPMPIPMIGGQLPPITTKPMPETKNMAVGGMMTPSTYQVPTNIATQPSYFQNYTQSTAPFQPFQPQTPTPNAPFQGLNNAVGQNTTGPSFNTLMPQLTGKRETKEYRNAAGQKLFIPFISGKPIYPIPEGYTLYVAENIADPSPTTPTTQTTSVLDNGDGGDVGIETTRGMSIDKYGKGKTDNSLSVAQNTKSVMDAVAQAKGAGKFGRAIQTLGMAAMPFGLSQLSSNIGKPDPTALNDMISQQQAAMGTYSGMTPEEIDQDPMGNLNAMSMQAYGMSLSDKATELGMGVMDFAQVAFTPGYKNGQVDPTTNATYSYGQATDDDGNVSYGGIGDFGIAMEAMGKTGFMGGLKDAERISIYGKTEKDRNRAKNFADRVKTPEFNAMRDDDRSNAEVSQGLDDAQTSAVNAANDAVSQATSGQTTSSIGFTDTSAFGHDGPGDNSNSNDGSTDAVGGDGDEGESPDADDDPGFKQGGLAGKKKQKPKPNKKKQGGLASRK